MRIEELLDQAMENNYTDLQALIMFLVYEKKVLTLEDDTKELDLYFLEKHNKRMNKELIKYKHKINMNYGLNLYALTKNRVTTFVVAENARQAIYIAKMPDAKVKLCTFEELNINGQNVAVKELTDKPRVLGRYKHPNYEVIV